jgi:hypothetical protein
MTTLSVRFIDYSNEVAAAAVYVDDAITNGDATTLATAIDGLSIGTREKITKTLSTILDQGLTTPPANKFAQRELRFVCKYTDSITGKRYSFSIPCADANLVVGNTDLIDLTAGAGLALKTAFENDALSELGNAVVLNSVELVGRNSS